MRQVRFIRPFALTAVLAVVLAACSAGEAPGWTFAPTPTPSTAPSVGPSGSAGTSAAPPESAAPSGSTVPSGGTGGTVLTEVASGIQFQTTTLEAPANQPFQITFDNQDASVPHNIQIADASGALVFEGDTVNGVAQISYTVPALAAGSYKFSCKWHPTMVGELTVK